MLKYTNIFLRQQLIGVSSSYQSERLFPTKLTRAASGLPAFFSAVRAAKRLPSHVQIHQKGR